MHLPRRCRSWSSSWSVGAGFALVTEEALQTADLHPLAAWIDAQPEWSDFPFVLLTRRGGGIERNPAAMRLLQTLGNVTFLERPVPSDHARQPRAVGVARSPAPVRSAGAPRDAGHSSTKRWRPASTPPSPSGKSWRTSSRARTRWSRSSTTIIVSLRSIGRARTSSNGLRRPAARGRFDAGTAGARTGHPGDSLVAAGRARLPARSSPRSLHSWTRRMSGASSR